MLAPIDNHIGARMSTPTTVKSTQIVAGVAVVLALLGGAYAVGRSQGVSTPPPAEEPTSAVTQKTEPAPQRVASAEPAPQRAANTEPAREARPAPAQRDRASSAWGVKSKRNSPGRSGSGTATEDMQSPRM